MRHCGRHWVMQRYYVVAEQMATCEMFISVSVSGCMGIIISTSLPEHTGKIRTIYVAPYTVAYILPFLYTLWCWMMHTRHQPFKIHILRTFITNEHVVLPQAVTGGHWPGVMAHTRHVDALHAKYMPPVRLCMWNDCNHYINYCFCALKFQYMTTAFLTHDDT